MKLPSYFKDFLATIRLQEEHLKQLSAAHKQVRRQLMNDEKMSDLIISTFLQGSYRRGTAIRPSEGRRVDIDVVVVTKVDESATPEQAMEAFKPFLNDHYSGGWEQKARCFRVAVGPVHLDLVVTSVPSEAHRGLKSSTFSVNDEFEGVPELHGFSAGVSSSQRIVCKSSVAVLKRAQGQDTSSRGQLKIPDLDAKKWDVTNPLEQIRWTRNKNSMCNGHYINVVKAIKWWHRENGAVLKYPKGYSLEHLIGVSCPDGIRSIAAGVTLTLENIVIKLAQHYADGTVPKFDHYGVSDCDVWNRVTPEHFKAFYGEVRKAATIARRAFDLNGIRESTLSWAELFGSSFPSFRRPD